MEIISIDLECIIICGITMKKPYLIKKAYCDGKLQKDDVMSVNLVVNKAPVAVGTAALSSEDMYMSGKDLYQVEETLETLREFSMSYDLSGLGEARAISYILQSCLVLAKHLFSAIFESVD